MLPNIVINFVISILFCFYFYFTAFFSFFSKPPLCCVPFCMIIFVSFGVVHHLSCMLVSTVVSRINYATSNNIQQNYIEKN